MIHVGLSLGPPAQAGATTEAIVIAIVNTIIITRTVINRSSPLIPLVEDLVVALVTAVVGGRNVEGIEARRALIDLLSDRLIHHRAGARRVVIPVRGLPRALHGRRESRGVRELMGDVVLHRLRQDDVAVRVRWRARSREGGRPRAIL